MANTVQAEQKPARGGSKPGPTIRSAPVGEGGALAGVPVFAIADGGQAGTGAAAPDRPAGEAREVARDRGGPRAGVVGGAGGGSQRLREPAVHVVSRAAARMPGAAAGEEELPPEPFDATLASFESPPADVAEERAPVSVEIPRLAAPGLEKPTFAAPSELPSEALSFPPRRANVSLQEFAADQARVTAEAGEAYRTSTMGARGQADVFFADASALYSSAITHFRDVSDGVIPTQQALDVAADDLAAEAVRSLQATATEADQSLEMTYLSALAHLRRTERRSRARVGHNATTAAAQVDDIIKDLQSQFTATLQGAITDSKTASDRACKKLRDWESNLLADFPESGGTPRDDVYNEAKRLSAPPLAAQDRETLGKIHDKAKENFEAANKSINDSIDKGYRPPLDKRAKSIREEGQAAVTRAVRDAVRLLREQATDGRRAIAEGSRSAIGAIVAEQRALRNRVRGRTMQLLRTLHAMTTSLLNGLSFAVRAIGPAFPRSLDQLRLALGRAARLGSPVLKHVARSSARQMEQAADNARLAQTQRLRGNQVVARADLRQRDVLGRREMQAELEQSSDRVRDSRVNSEAKILHASDTYAEAFDQGSQNVAQVADSWSEPIARTFGSMIKQAKKALDEDHTKFLQGSEGKPGFTKNKQDLLDVYQRRDDPVALFDAPPITALTTAATERGRKCEAASDDVNAAFTGGFAWSVNQAGVTQALHGLTKIMGVYVSDFYAHVHGDLRQDLWKYLWDEPDEYNAAINYLNGNAVAGARYELAASKAWYNDDEPRIKRTMADLNPDQLKELGSTEEGRREIAATRDALDGLDLDVFNALADGHYARAEALELRDKADEALRSGNADAVEAAVNSYSVATDSGYGGRVLTAAEHRREVMRELGQLVRESGVTIDTSVTGGKAVEKLTEEERDVAMAAAYVTRDVQVQVTRRVGKEDFETETITRHLDSAARARIVSLVREGEGSETARMASVSVELGRSGGPKLLNLDAALVDERFNPDRVSGLSPEDLQKLREERNQFIINLAKERSGGAPVPDITAARAILTTSLETAFRDDALGARIATRLITEDYPSPDTAALMMEHATIHQTGTNTDLIDRVLGRMNRDDIFKMRERFKANTNRDLDDVLGTFGGGAWSLTELSGDDRLHVEEKLMGVPRNDQEAFEVAALKIRQQRGETGVVGSVLSWGSGADEGLTYAEGRLAAAAGGGPMRFDRFGRLISGGNFDKDGKLRSGDRQELQLAGAMAHRTAAHYAAYIDNLATTVTTAIAVIGAVVATVLTFGAATPLAAAMIAGAVTLSTGLLAMGAHRLISGGRYGWEQALLDLGTTAVQALTAGVGAGLGASLNAAKGAAAIAGAGEQATARAATGVATRGVARAVVNNLIVGTTTGVMGSVGHTVFDPKTWEGGWEGALEALFHAAIRGALTGAATSLVSSAVEAIPAGRLDLGRGLEKVSLGERMSNSSNMLFRGLTKAAASGMGGAAGRGVELTYDRATGRFKGDAGDILVAMGEAGAQSSIQSFGEGAGEARAHAAKVRREAAVRSRVEEARRPAVAGPAEGRATPGRALPVPEPRVTVAPPSPEAARVAPPPARAGEVTTPEPAAPPPAPTAPVRAGAEPDVLARPTMKVEEALPPPVPAPARPAVSGEAELAPPAPAAPAARRPSEIPEDVAATGARRPAAPGEPAEGVRPTEPAKRPPAAAAPAPETVAPTARPAPELEAPRPGRAPAPGEPEARALAPAKPTEAVPEPTARRPAPGEFVEGTAAGVRDSEFHGRAAETGAADAAQTRTVKGAVRRLLGSGAPEFEGAHLPNPNDPTRIVLKTRSGEEVPVRVRLTETPLPPGPDGMSPVARFTYDKGTGEYTIEVSAGAKARHVERALAHELAEIRVGHGRTEATEVKDFLVPGRQTPEGAEPRLSPHDEGRLAELGVIARQMKMARTAVERTRLAADAEELVAHLGLAGSGEAADARRALAHAVLADRPEAQGLLEDAVRAHAPAAAMLADIAAKRRMAAPSGLVEEETLKIPGRPEMEMRPGDPRAGRSTVGETPADAQRIAASLRKASREEAGRMLQDAILKGEHTLLTKASLEYLTPEQIDYVAEHGRLPPGVEYHHVMALADYLEFAHRGDVGLGLPKDVHLGVGHGYAPSRPLEAATLIAPEEPPGFQVDREAVKGFRPRRAEVATGARTTGDVDRDIQIEQGALLRRMQGDAERLENMVARLQDRLARLRAGGATEERLGRVEQRLGDVQERLAGLNRRIAETAAGLEATARLAAEAEPVGGTAAGLRGTDFHGDAVPVGSARAASSGRADAAVERLVSPEGVLSGVARLPDADDPRTIRLETRGGEEVTVRVEVSKTLLPVEADGLRPVARFDPDPDHPGQYVIRVSPGASHRHLERALAHELGEIRAQHGRPRVDDVLTPGGRPVGGREAARSLSPHDEGRLAELAVIARQLATTTDASARIRLRDDAERLVSALGLVGPSDAAGGRRAVALAALESKAALRWATEARALLGEAVVDAERNPYLLRSSGDSRADLATLRATLDRVNRIDDPAQQAAWREQLTRVAAQVLIDARVVRPTRRAAVVRPMELARLLGLDLTRPPAFTPTAADPFEALLARAMTDARRGLDSGTMVHRDSRKPTPGFEAEFVDDAGRPVPLADATRTEAAITPSGLHVERRVAARQARIAQRERLETELRTGNPSPERRAEIERTLETVEKKIREHSARLGEAAGREFARLQFGTATEQEIAHTGAGVPDLLYETPDGRLIMVECKGGTAPLGARESADGRFMVQQGTLEYAQSIARAMENSPDPATRALGARLRDALARNPPALEYYLVRQPFTATGDLAPPEWGRFDLAPNRPR